MAKQKSTLKAYYGDRLDTKEDIQKVVNELETECNDLNKIVEFNNYNVPNRVLISLGTKKELLEDAKKELDNFQN